MGGRAGGRAGGGCGVGVCVCVGGWVGGWVWVCVAGCEWDGGLGGWGMGGGDWVMAWLVAGPCQKNPRNCILSGQA